MGKYKLLRKIRNLEPQEVAAGTLAEVYDALFSRESNGWRALSAEYGNYSIQNPDGTERERDYEEHQKHEQRQRKALFFTRREKLAEIVRALGWEPVIKKDSGQGANGFYYPDNVWLSAEKDGASFTLHIGYPDRTKAHVSGHYPGRHHYGQKNPSINVSYERAPEAAARDIAKRFLPDFLAALEEHRKKEAAADDHETRTLAALRIVKGWDLSEHEKDKKTVFDGLPEGVYSVQVNGPTSARLEISTTPENARKVLDLLQMLEPAEDKAEA